MAWRYYDSHSAKVDQRGRGRIPQRSVSTEYDKTRKCGALHGRVFGATKPCCNHQVNSAHDQKKTVR